MALQGCVMVAEGPVLLCEVSKGCLRYKAREALALPNPVSQESGGAAASLPRLFSFLFSLRRGRRPTPYLRELGRAAASLPRRLVPKGGE